MDQYGNHALSAGRASRLRMSPKTQDRTQAMSLLEDKTRQLGIDSNYLYDEYTERTGKNYDNVSFGGEDHSLKKQSMIEEDTPAWMRQDHGDVKDLQY
jgi:hypothetical protein